MIRNRRSSTSRTKRGFTLIEQVVSLSIITVLLTGLGSAVVLSTNALPTKDSVQNLVIQDSQLVEQIASELATARTVSERLPTSITFTVPDRNNDAVDETIRYAWSGTAGDPLTRRYNALSPVDIASTVKSFNLDYVTASTSTTSKVETSADDPEAVIASFDGWSGLTPTSLDQTVNASSTTSQYFVVTPPTDATQLRITKARVMLKRALSSTGSLSVGIRRPKTDGTYAPSTAYVGTPISVSGASVFTTYIWSTVTFSDVIVNDFSRKDFCLYLQHGGGTTFYAQGYLNVAAPANQTVLRWSTDLGVNWLPAMGLLDQQDLRYYVYGIYTRTTTSTVVATKNALTGVGITLRTQDEPQSRLDTFVQLVNVPDVTGL